MVLLAFIAASVAPAAAQSIVWVDDGSCPGPGSGTEADPYCSIQNAICNHRNDAGGVTIRVKPGTYNEAIRMFPGVDLISTDGPDVTFIDPTGKACYTSSCTVGTTTPCSAVYFPTNANGRLEGFTVHNGHGLHQTCSGTCDLQIGGGVLVFASAPTITRNTIENNVVSAASSQTILFYGGGIYANGTDGAPAQPVITRNLIRANDVTPPGGTNGKPSFSFGGGIYAGFNSSPTIQENTIDQNSSGDGAPFQYSAGAGVALYSGFLATSGLVQRNVIRGNDAADYGGGLLLGESDPNVDGVIDPSRGIVENNIIHENISYDGGGVYSATSLVTVRNNTIADNTAAVRGTLGGHGGGIHADPPTQGTAQATFVNNIVAFNEAHAGPDGGGIGGGLYVETGANPTVRYDDLNGNVPTEVGGSKTDGDYIGVNGNISANPAFVDRTPGARDYHLLPGGPAIDAGDGSFAPATDYDGAPRPQDGDGNASSLVDMGAFEFSPDFDGDGVPDWQDPDDDDDGVPDVSDCLPRDRGVSRAPDAVGNTLEVDKTSGGRLHWLRSVQGHTYNVYRGDLSSPWSYDETCITTETPDAEALEATNPAPGTGFYYVVGAHNACGSSPIGQDGQGQDRGPASPCGTLDADTDADTLRDPADNCPRAINSNQGDVDADWVGDACDNCASMSNPDQGDPDGDGRGVACDNCPGIANPGQTDTDSDTRGDACDNCVSVANADQTDTDLDALGDACDPDDDNDLVDDGVDNCPLVANADQANADLDALGDACDPDDDNDGVADVSDCAPLDPALSMPPVEAESLALSRSATTDLSWTAQPASVYDVCGGDVGQLRADGSVAAAGCLANDLVGTTWSDTRPDPPPGSGLYYLVRAQNSCGTGTYGSSSAGAPRTPADPCP